MGAPGLCTRPLWIVRTCRISDLSSLPASQSWSLPHGTKLASLGQVLKMVSKCRLRPPALEYIRIVVKLYESYAHLATSCWTMRSFERCMPTAEVPEDVLIEIPTTSVPCGSCSTTGKRAVVQKLLFDAWMLQQLKQLQPHNVNLPTNETSWVQRFKAWMSVKLVNPLESKGLKSDRLGGESKHQHATRTKLFPPALHKTTRFTCWVMQVDIKLDTRHKDAQGNKCRGSQIIHRCGSNLIHHYTILNMLVSEGGWKTKTSTLRGTLTHDLVLQEKHRLTGLFLWICSTRSSA